VTERIEPVGPPRRDVAPVVPVRLTPAERERAKREREERRRRRAAPAPRPDAGDEPPPRLDLRA
jgi:hypothetical protein